MGEWKYSSTIFGVGTGWRWVVTVSYPDRFATWERAVSTLWIGCCVDSGLDAAEYRKFSYLCQESDCDRPTHSPLLYRLSYLGVRTSSSSSSSSSNNDIVFSAGTDWRLLTNWSLLGRRTSICAFRFKIESKPDAILRVVVSRPFYRWTQELKLVVTQHIRRLFLI
jgi:hypothetical protein